MTVPVTLSMQLSLLGRILLAGFLGALLGYERQSRRKIAGIRTHVIISVTAALMIVLSKYGFSDVLSEYVRVDPSRVAASIVAAIGFIGSGVIHFKNDRVSGLTTSAGIWAAVGIGMCIGAGMYLLGIACTIIILLVELFLGRKGILAENNSGERRLQIEYVDSEQENDILRYITKCLQDNKCDICNISVKTRSDGVVHFSAMVSFPLGMDMSEILRPISGMPGIKKITF